jgi:hypothetical protein
MKPGGMAHPAVERQRQENHEFETNMGHRVKPCLTPPLQKTTGKKDE